MVDLGVRGFVPLSQLASLGALERPDSGEAVPGAVRALVGSIGIVAAVPVTTLVAVGLIGRRLPFVGEGSGTRHAPGWD